MRVAEHFWHSGTIEVVKGEERGQENRPV
jgi:hypothetical protein